MSDSGSDISGDLLALVDSDDESKREELNAASSTKTKSAKAVKRAKKGTGTVGNGRGRGKAAKSQDSEDDDEESDDEGNEESESDSKDSTIDHLAKEKALKGVAAKRKRAPAKKMTVSKKVKSDDDSDSPTTKSLAMYPLEGQYKDEADRERLLGMSEMQREEILAERQEEINRLKEAAELERMVNERESGGVLSIVKRPHQGTGKTEEKSTKLEELKSIRKRKQERRARAGLSSDDEDYDAVDRKLSRRPAGRGRGDGEDSEDSDSSAAQALSGSSKAAEPLTLDVVKSAQLTRSNAAKWCLAPWFKEVVTGTFVRYAIGPDPQTKQTQYRLCEVIDVQTSKSGRVYRCEGTPTNQQILLRHGKAVKLFPLDAISNSAITEQEFSRWLVTCKQERVQMPRAADLTAVSTKLQKREQIPFTNEEFNHILAKKAELSGGDRGTLVAEIARMKTTRAGALAQQDFDTVQRLDKKIADLERTRQNKNETALASSNLPTSAVPSVDFASPGSAKKPPEMDRMKALAEINERNRKASALEVRQAEMRRAEERRRFKKAAEAGHGAVATSADPFARVKTQVRLNFDSREATPMSSGPPSPKLNPVPKEDKLHETLQNTESVVKPKNRFEEMVQKAGVADLDLGDF